MLNDKKILDCIVIGAGPAGVQSAYFLKKYGFNYLVVEKSPSAGNFYKEFPRHKTLISINKRYTGKNNNEFSLRHDWNSLLSDTGPRFTDYDNKLFPCASSLVEYLNDYVGFHDLDISYNTEVKKLTKTENIFKVELSDNRILFSKSIISATGFIKPNIPDIQGIEYAEQYVDFSVDKNDFAGQRVLIIGKGNSAFETADNLVDTAALIHLVSRHSLRLAWRTHYVGDLRAVNNNILDMYQLKSQHAALDAEIVKLVRKNNTYSATFKYAHAEGEVETISYDRILCCAGFKINTEIYDQSCMPALTMNDKYPKLTDAYESINVPGLYFAGTVTHASDYRKGTSGFIHGFRYNIKALAGILGHRTKNKPIQSKKLDYCPEILAGFIIDRINIASSIWQQVGVLAEFIKLENDEAYHYDALPHAYGINDYFKNNKAISLTFEYGEEYDGDVFSQSRIARDNYQQSSKSQFLHPVIRFYDKGKLVKDFHIIEDLEASWTHEEHFAHVFKFLEQIIEVTVVE